MARTARVVLPGVAHHVTQRGNRRLETFFQDDDYESYKSLLSANCAEAGVAVWGYCLMPNHVHLILVPSDTDGLSQALSRTHKRYAERINRRYDWSGHLWQGRFSSVAMDNAHLLAAAKYVELNPVRARLCDRAKDWRWSSARAHLAGKPDGLVDPAPLLEEIGDWNTFLAVQMDEKAAERLRANERGSRPLGDDAFLKRAGISANP